MVAILGRRGDDGDGTLSSDTQAVEIEVGGMLWLAAAVLG